MCTWIFTRFRIEVRNDVGVYVGVNVAVCGCLSPHQGGSCIGVDSTSRCGMTGVGGFVAGLVDARA